MNKNYASQNLDAKATREIDITYSDNSSNRQTDNRSSRETDPVKVPDSPTQTEQDVPPGIPTKQER